MAPTCGVKSLSLMSDGLSETFYHGEQEFLNSWDIEVTTVVNYTNAKNLDNYTKYFLEYSSSEQNV